MTLLLLKDDDEALFEDDEAIFAEEEDLLLLDPIASLQDDDEALFEDRACHELDEVEAIPLLLEEDLLLLDPFDTADCGACPELVEGHRVTLLLRVTEEEEGSSSLRVAHDSASRS